MSGIGVSRFGEQEPFQEGGEAVSDSNGRELPRTFYNKRLSQYEVANGNDHER
jgi:hypothetical protein